MKKIILLFCFILLSSNSFAQVVFTENFDYPAGDSIGAHGWISNSGGATNRILVTSPGMTYAGYPLSGIGNSTYLTNNGQDEYNVFSKNDSVGSFYASFMVRIDSAKAQGDYFLAMLQTGSTTFYEGRVQAAARNGGLAFGITKGNATTDTAVAGVWTPSTYSFGTTYLLVLKYTFVAGGNTNDQVSLFVFSSGMPATEPAPTLGPNTYPSLDATSMGRIALRQGTATRAPSGAVDGIRVTTSWMPSVWDIKLAVQGLYDQSTGQLTRRDTVAVYLHSIISPYPVIDSSKAVVDSVSLTGTYAFANAPDGNYYLVVRYRNLDIYRNGVTTWSKLGGQALTRLNGSYDFTTSASQAFGNNQILLGSVYSTYNGDQNQDNTVDVTDVINVYNANTNFLTGYVSEDMNGDNQVTLTDVLLTFNNAASFVEVKAP